jgi:hypothetical protein
VRRRTTGRFALALAVVIAAYQLGFVRLLNAGGSVAGGWGIVVALLVGGLVVAVLFTAVYDGPRALVGVLMPWHRTSGTRAR